MIPRIDETHAPEAKSWVDGADDHPDFPVQNLPFGIATMPGGSGPRGAVAIGDMVLDLAAIAELLSGEARAAALLCDAPALNRLFAQGNAMAHALRKGVFALLTDQTQADRVSPNLHRSADCTLHLPFTVGDYTDFYAGIHHAANIGRMFRPDNPLLPNYKHVPIGYHGRASSICPSGEAVVRPSGQRLLPGCEEPDFGPCEKLDYELEIGIWIAGSNRLGEPVPIARAASRIAGLTLLNDWSARDLQAWEYQPLGPFLAKSFHSTVSPWLVTSSALAPFRRPQPAREDSDPKPLPYLTDPADQASGAFGVTMEVHIATPAMRRKNLVPQRLSRGPMTSMYWTAAQLIAHHASNGCNLRPGDLLGTGTLSTAERTGYGSLMELSENGKREIELGSGETRRFIEDGDEIVMTAHADADGFRSIGFGECRARIKAGCAFEP